MDIARGEMLQPVIQCIRIFKPLQRFRALRRIYVFIRSFAIFLSLLGIISFGYPFGSLPTALADSGVETWVDSDAETIGGSALFEAHCSGCHVGGGNIIRRGKNLKLKTLKRNQLDTVEAIAQLVTNGKGIMSAYSDRLTPAEIETVSSFVIDQANSDWH